MSRAKTGKKTETPPFCRFLSRNSERNRLPEKRCATLGAAPTRFWKGALDASAATLAPFLQAGDSARHRRAFRQSRRSLTEPPRADKAATFFMPCDGIKGAPRRRRRQYKTARRVGWAPMKPRGDGTRPKREPRADGGRAQRGRPRNKTNKHTTAAETAPQAGERRGQEQNERKRLCNCRQGGCPNGALSPPAQRLIILAMGARVRRALVRRAERSALENHLLKLLSFFVMG